MSLTPLPEIRSTPSDEAWRRSGEIGARIMRNLAEREARAEAERLAAHAA